MSRYGYGTGKCRDCGVSIRFLRLDTGKVIPVDPLPDDRGNVAARRVGLRWGLAYVVSKAKPLLPEHALFMPHHGTCSAGRGQSRPRPAVAPIEPLF